LKPPQRKAPNPALRKPVEPGWAPGDDGVLASLLERNRRTLEARSTVVLNCPGALTAGAVMDILADSPVHFFNRDALEHRAVSQALDGAGDAYSAEFDPWLGPASPWDSAIVFLPKGRALAEMDLAMVVRAVRAGGSIALTGRLREGIRSARETLEAACGRVKLEDAARHALFFSAVREREPSGRASLDDWAVEFPAEARGRKARMFSFPGVFSHGRLDEGTALLLEHLPPEPVLRILDFGCGSGAIGTFTALEWPDAELVMVDSSALAVEASKRTLAANGITNASVRTSCELPTDEEPFDLVLSNPPFHAGNRAEYSVMQKLWEGATGLLERRGKLVIVLTGGVPRGVLDEERYQRVRTLAKHGAHRVIEAMK